jgi:hypothetical protein
MPLPEAALGTIEIPVPTAVAAKPPVLVSVTPVSVSVPSNAPEVSEYPTPPLADAAPAL